MGKEPEIAMPSALSQLSALSPQSASGRPVLTEQGTAVTDALPDPAATAIGSHAGLVLELLV